jgi:vacuolar-type H+-ATPase subunit I/STV1
LRLPQEAAGHPEQLMDELQTRLADANDHLAAVKQERQHLAGRWEEELLELLRCAKADAEVADTISQFAHEGQAYLVRGQVSENALHDLLQKVEAVTKGKASIEGRL